MVETSKIVDKLFRLADQDCDGILTPDQAMEFLANLSNARPRSGIDKSNLEWLEQVFRQTVGNEKEIRRDDFKKIVISKNPFFTERVFQIFDKDNSGSISLQEFIDAMHQFAGQSPDDKIRFLFKVYDLDVEPLQLLLIVLTKIPEEIFVLGCVVSLINMIFLSSLIEV
uniref:EF-hand domain-containing protein n=1 Tax=Timema poppense TaxID=170557 RepID=A0A7R9CZV2_TIMPO|nr:unnamed protein product [Timema poppensis]